MRWEYEPRTFVLARGADGCPTSAFTPDFFLPDHDRYIEVTTLRQRLVTRKNRKLRALRAAHPDVDVDVLYRRDYRQLRVKYGLAAAEQPGPESAPVRARSTEPAGLLGSGGRRRNRSSVA